VAGAIRGILVVMRRPTAVATTDDEWLLSALADQAAVALEKTRLDEIGEFRELLIGIVGHDLRNPLSTILMGAHLLLQREGLGEKETEIVRKMTNSASVAARMIDQLLDLTRSRLGRGIPVDAKCFDLNDVVQQLVGETELMHPDRPLHVESSGDLVGTWDSDRVHQLLGNLVGNAVEHGEPRTPIELRVEGRQGEVCIEVSNRGAPIPPAAMSFVFEAFRQGRAARKPRSRGLGLGLFIAQEIARAHGGSISVTSSEREGTKFVVLLPRGAASI
jgi:phosphoserine phosphatase RsbU/P